MEASPLHFIEDLFCKHDTEQLWIYQQTSLVISIMDLFFLSATSFCCGEYCTVGWCCTPHYVWYFSISLSDILRRHSFIVSEFVYRSYFGHNDKFFSFQYYFIVTLYQIFCCIQQKVVYTANEIFLAIPNDLLFIGPHKCHCMQFLRVLQL